MIVSQSGREVETVCGQSCHLGSNERISARFTMWNSLVTCKRCRSQQAVRTKFAAELTKEVLARGN
jgi:hypothetical protein